MKWRNSSQDGLFISTVASLELAASSCHLTRHKSCGGLLDTLEASESWHAATFGRQSLCLLCCGWWLVLICYERIILLTGWYLVAGADLVWENNTTGWLADKPNEHSERSQCEPKVAAATGAGQAARRLGRRGGEKGKKTATTMWAEASRAMPGRMRWAPEGRAGWAMHCPVSRP